MQFYFLFKLSNTSLSVYPFSLALPIKSALFASALVLALSGHGLLLAQSRTLQHFPDYWEGPFVTSGECACRSTKGRQHKGPCAMPRRLRHPPRRLFRTLLVSHIGTMINTPRALGRAAAPGGNRGGSPLPWLFTWGILG